jgi:fermentation-respiration switch protein FrsA (DUF1100 family)
MSAKGPPQGGIFVGVYIYWSGVVARVVVRTHIDICFGDSFHYPRDNTKIKIEWPTPLNFYLFLILF